MRLLWQLSCHTSLKESSCWLLPMPSKLTAILKTPEDTQLILETPKVSQFLTQPSFGVYPLYVCRCHCQICSENWRHYFMWLSVSFPYGDPGFLFLHPLTHTLNTYYIPLLDSPQNSFVLPQAEGYTVYSSSQWPQYTQAAVATVLGINSNEYVKY